jgi:FAD/FMN-containing dehydrogenase
MTGRNRLVVRTAPITTAVVQPDSATDVAAVVRWCVVNGVAIVPQGGNTGLCPPMTSPVRDELRRNPVPVTQASRPPRR